MNRFFDINSELAQQIVDSVKSVVSFDINFIDRKGIITASTNAERIGNFHESGYKTAESGVMGVVSTDDEYRGTKKGINYPIIYDGNVMGVIGITGEPTEVERYGFLITKISEVFIRENFQKVNSLDERRRTERLVFALIYNYADDIEPLAHELGFDLTGEYAVMLIKTDRAAQVQKHLELVSENRKKLIYGYIFPDKIAVVVPNIYEKIVIRTIEKLNADKLNCGIGTKEKVDGLSESYRYAQLALGNAVKNNERITAFDDMTINIITESIDAKTKKKFSERMLKGLTDEDIKLLAVYYDNSMSLKQTADELHIHKNTLQYRLEQIYRKTGFNPREFKDAVLYYMSIQL